MTDERAEETSLRARRGACLAVALLAASLLGVRPGAAQAEDETIGRLFFTPERRAAMDRQRQFNVQQARVMEGASLTVLTNSEVRPHIDARDPSRVLLKAGEEAPASLRVGESINRTTREKQDGLEGGRITVRRSHAPAP
ncbi:MAG: hypothetical protein H6R11_971 [Proteobacteria bacterium]|nr:hypothetical protein [Pseudomonadota bacterium]